MALRLVCYYVQALVHTLLCSFLAYFARLLMRDLLYSHNMQVFREYFPKKQEATIVLECIWQTDKYVLVERTSENEMNNPEDEHGDVLPSSSKIQYENIEAFLGGINSPQMMCSIILMRHFSFSV